jgi:hypothetical protein
VSVNAFANNALPIRTARGLAKDGDLVGIAAKLRNVVANPFERKTLISKPCVLRALLSEGVGLRGLAMFKFRQFSEILLVLLKEMGGDQPPSAWGHAGQGADEAA